MYYPSEKINSDNPYFQALITNLKEQYPNFSSRAIIEKWEKNGILEKVSVATLNNIFSAINKNENRNFNYDVVDVISKCLGFDNFVDFLKKYCTTHNITYIDDNKGGLRISIPQEPKIEEPKIEETKKEEIEKTENPPKIYVFVQKLKKIKYVYISIIFVAFLGIGLVKHYSYPTKITNPMYTLELISRENTDERLVEIEYDVSQIPSENIEIHAGRDANPSFIRKLDKKKGGISFFHMHPDYRPLYLVIDNQYFHTGKFTHVTDSNIVCTITKTYKENGITKSDLGNRFPKDEFHHEGFLGLTKKLPVIDASDYWQHFRYFNENTEKFLGNDFVFELEVSNNEKDGGIDCYDSFFYICTEKQYITVNFVGKNCGNWGYVRVGKDMIDKTQNTEKTKYLNQDFQQFRNVKVISKNNTLFVHYEGRLLCELPYSEKNLGKIKGVIMGFKGSGGKIRNAILSNNKTQLKLF